MTCTNCNHEIDPIHGYTRCPDGEIYHPACGPQDEGPFFDEDELHHQRLEAESRATPEADYFTFVYTF